MDSRLSFDAKVLEKEYSHVKSNESFDSQNSAQLKNVLHEMSQMDN